MTDLRERIADLIADARPDPGVASGAIADRILALLSPPTMTRDEMIEALATTLHASLAQYEGRMFGWPSAAIEAWIEAGPDSRDRFLAAAIMAAKLRTFGETE